MTTTAESTSASSAGMFDFFDQRLLWKHKWSLLCCIALSAGLGGAYMSQEDPIYEVTSRILVQMERMSTEKESLLRSDRTFLVTQGEVVGSPVVVQSALQVMNKTPDAAPDFVAADAAIRALKITTVDDANVLRLTYRHGDPQYAIDLLKAIVNSYRAYNKDMHQGQYVETLQALTQHEQELRGQLRTLEEDFLQFRMQSPIVGQGNEVTRTNTILLEQLAMGLTSARALRIDKEMQLQTLVQARDAQSSNQLLSDSRLFPTSLDIPATEGAVAPVVPVEAFKLDDRFSGGAYLEPVRIEEQLWQAETRLKEISQTFGVKHPERKALMEEIDMLKARLKECAEAEPARLELQLAALKETEKYLIAEHAAEYEKVKSLDSSLLQGQKKQAEIERVRGVYLSITEQLRSLKLANEAPLNGQASITVRVLEPPDATAKLVWPRPLQFIGICGVFGFALGCIVITVAARATGRR